MPPEVRELIEELTRAGSKDRGGKGNHRTLYTKTFLYPLQFQEIQATMQSTIKYVLYAEQLRNRSNERQCEIRKDCRVVR